MNEFTEEINRRRTFAIISHPDAGKTTLTEKFLLYGGAINLAGSVKGKASTYSPLPGMQFLTGWRSRKREVFRLPHQCCSSNMEDIVLISWTHPGIRISQRTHTAL